MVLVLVMVMVIYGWMVQCLLFCLLGLGTGVVQNMLMVSVQSFGVSMQ